jgi:hypothetical protein
MASMLGIVLPALIVGTLVRYALMLLFARRAAT